MMKAIVKHISCLLIILCVILQYNVKAQTKDTSNLKPMLVTLNLDSSAYQDIFNGPQKPIGMYSGLVTLLPNEDVGVHYTDEYQEMLVILSGEGQMIFADGKTFNLKYGVIAYCPPYTEHNVKNISGKSLKYIYIASKTK
jgi:oxalate decarboxylase/phosphoglucose isomerase-like protein (cupin superfamily)